jgi:trk system potassium uptake protein TrkA
VAHGDAKHCKVIGRKIEEIDLPDGATIAAIVRNTGQSRTEYKELVPYEVPIFEVIMAHHDTVIRAEDHVIVFCTSKKLVAKVEKLFQVGWGFF